MKIGKRRECRVVKEYRNEEHEEDGNGEEMELEKKGENAEL